MSDATKAVFVSYAREDTDAARRIAEALRSHGVEVWFDQNELRGGDAWDGKIRKQINDCALFLPIVSQRTQERLEGYFRLEWKLAANRSHTMAEEKAFLLPVVIDATRDAEGKVPTEFRSVQWTKLPGGESSTGFVTHVQQLLGRTIAPVAAAVHASSQTSAPTQAPRSELLRWVSAALSVAVVALVAFVLLRPSSKDAAPAPKPVAETKPAPPLLPAPAVPRATGSALPAPANNSIAVLAFANFGGDKENEYFSDGITEELLNVLAKVPGLRVAARTSAFYFKDKNVPIPEIAQKLNVAYVVEGSVQKSGTRVKITAQLIKASDGFHVWSDTFTRELKDVFAMQDEIAGLIAKNLQLTLGDAPRVAKTVNPEAHRLVLEGRYFWNQRNDEAFARAEVAFKRALAIDPEFAEAHAGLAAVLGVRGWYRLMAGNRASAEADFAHAKEEVRRAQALNPELAEPSAIIGLVLMNELKFNESERQFTQALALNPNDATVRHFYANLLGSQGRLDEAVKEIERSLSLDPLSPNANWTKASWFGHAGRVQEALDATDLALALRPRHPDILSARALALWKLGRRDEAIATARAIGRDLTAQPRWSADPHAIYVLRLAGLQSEAEAYAERALANVPKDDFRYGMTLVALGRDKEALSYLRTLNVSGLTSLYWAPMWDSLRDDVQFQRWVVTIGRGAEYQVARETLARMLKEQAAKK